MTSPSGDIIARAYVEIIPEIRNFSKKLRENMRASSRELRTLDRELAPVSRAIGAIGLAVTGIVPGVQLLTKSLQAMTVQSIIGGFVALGGAASVAVGAIGVIPAAGVAAASALGALAIGVRGVSDVLEDFFDPEKFAEGLEELSDNARSTLGVLDEFRGEVEGLFDAVQDSLFAGLDDVLRDSAGTFLPRLQEHFTNVAGTINLAAKDLAGFLQQADTLADFDRITSNTELTFRNLRNAVLPAAQAVRDIVTVGSDFLPLLADEVTKVTTRFANFIAMARITGDLQTWIREGIETVKQVFAILGNAGGAVRAILQAAEDSGLGLLDTLERITASAEEFFQSAEGRDAVVKFLDSAERSAKALLPVLGAVVSVFIEDLFPILADFAETVGPAATGFIDGLGDALSIAAPGIHAFAQGFAAFITAITPALPTLGTLLGQIGELVGAMAADFGPAIADVAVAIANVLMPIVNALTWTFETMGPVISRIVVVFGTLIALLAGLIGVVRGVQAVIGVLAGGFNLLFGAISKTEKGVRGITSFLSGPWGIVLGIATTALGLFLSTTDDSTQQEKEFAAAGKEVNDVLREQGGVVNALVREKAAEKLETEGVLDLANKLGISLGEVTSAYLDQGDALDVVRGKLKQIVEAQTVDPTLLSGDEQLTKEGQAAQDLLDKLNGLVKGREDDANATKRQGDAAREAGNPLALMNNILEAQRVALDLVYEARLRQQQQALESLNSEIGYFNQLERTRIELEEGARTLDVHTQAGRDNLTAVTQLVERGNARIAEMREEGATNEQLNATITTQQNELLGLLTPFFGSTEAARAFAEQLGLIPKTVIPTIGIVDNATPTLNRVQRMINNIIGGDYTIKIKASEAVPGLFQNIAPSGNARGGPVAAGEWSWVGEEGPELVRFGRAARVFSNDESNRMARDVGSLDLMTSRGGSGGGRAPTIGGSGGAPLTATVNVATTPVVKVYLGDRELTDLVRVELNERDRQLTQLVNVGTGRRQ